MAMLCIALTLIFAGMTLKGTVDRIQHARAGSAAHEHALFSDVAFDDGHDALQHMPDRDDPGHLPGGHHHHGDNAAGLILPTAAVQAKAMPLDDSYVTAPDQIAASLRATGLKRPPKASTISV